MAKGNMLLGQSRGSVGDVVFSRSYGQQIARARNRRPNNPKSDAQILQRAALATAGKAYSAGSVIFDHSFQGRRVGAECQQQFMALNIALLRQAYAADMEGPVSPYDAQGFFVQPGALGAVPFGYIVSQGTLQQNIFTIGTSDIEVLTLNWSVPTVAEGQTPTVADWLSYNNIAIGDIFTLVVLGYDDIGYGDALTQSFPAIFSFIRLIREGELTDALAAMPLSEATFGLLFRVETYGLTSRPSTPMSSVQILTGSVDLDVIGCPYYGAAGVIRSRDDSGERSTTYLTCSRSLAPMATNQLMWGVPSPALVDSWSGSTYTFQSPLILEGGDF